MDEGLEAVLMQARLFLLQQKELYGDTLYTNQKLNWSTTMTDEDIAQLKAYVDDAEKNGHATTVFRYRQLLELVDKLKAEIATLQTQNQPIF